MMEKELQIYLNGKFVEKSKAVVSVFDHGLLYGDGVFEGIRAYNGTVFKLSEHVARLYDSAKSIHLAIPVPPDGMAEAVLETLRRNHLRDAYVRLVVTRGPGDLGVDPKLCKDVTTFIIAEPMTSVLGPRDPKIVKLIISSVRRDSVDSTTHEIKSLNYLNSIMAKVEANNAGVDDAIMLDGRGFVSEGSATNVFIVKAGKLATPSFAAGVLHGVTRARLIQLCGSIGFHVEERDVTPFEVLTADEVFLAGTKSEILAVGSVNGVKVGSGSAGPITKKLVQEFSKIVSSPDEGTLIYEAEQVKA